ncbi:hypothetical protein FQN54_008413 [Arachnomyces sp. PD_36]|nr:hypothetical protein FQN54_008413 [Arachnomyces sp. PD_36]
MNNQYDITEQSSHGRLFQHRGTDEFSYSYQYPLEIAPPISQNNSQEPVQQETYAENVSQAPVNNINPASWQLPIQPPCNSLSTIPRPDLENVYQSGLDYSYPATCGVFMPQQYSFAPPTTTTDGPPAFNSFLGGWDGRKLADEAFEFSISDVDLSSYPQELLLLPEENSSVINVPKQCSESDQESLPFDLTSSRRPSASSYSMSSTGVIPPFDTSALSGYPEISTYGSDYTPRSSLALSSTPLSPLLSPRCPQPDISRTASTRSRASPSPRPCMRTAPYTLDGGRKRWSTGSYGPSSRRSSLTQHNQEQATKPSRFSMPSSTLKNLAPSNLTSSTNGSGKPARFHRSSFLLPSNIDSTGRFAKPVPLASNGPFRTLDSNVGPHGHPLDQYADVSDPPDLLGPLKEKQVSPSSEDMNPEDPELKPHEQDLRFDNDLYTPKWVRGHGNKREGWCGICKPGRWLVLKNSAFWYDKSFTHGISAATGQAFEGPEKVRKMEGSTEVWEGLCGSCGEWVALVSSKKKGTTWFRHAYKCHIHQKVKDVPKRNRESTIRYRPSSSNSNSKTPAPAPTTVPATTNPVTPPLPPAKIVGEERPGVKTVSPLQCISSMI